MILSHGKMVYFPTPEGIRVQSVIVCMYGLSYPQKGKEKVSILYHGNLKIWAACFLMAEKLSILRLYSHIHFTG